MYTKTELALANPRKPFFVRDKDVDEVNRLIAIVETRLCLPSIPIPGDIVTATGSCDTRIATIENFNDFLDTPNYTVCAQYSRVWLNPSGKTVSISGARFFPCVNEDFVHLGQAVQEFCIWSSSGPGANRDLCFFAKVNHWRVVKPNLICF